MFESFENMLLFISNVYKNDGCFLHNSVKEPNRMRQELILKPRIVN